MCHDDSKVADGYEVVYLFAHRQFILKIKFDDINSRT